MVKLIIVFFFFFDHLKGLILFNGQKKDGGDYVSLGLNNGVPEFKFDVGSGAAYIRGSAPLKLNKWHTIRLLRNIKNGELIIFFFFASALDTYLFLYSCRLICLCLRFVGAMEINKDENVTGVSPGKFESLDLQLPLHVGGVPESNFVSNVTGLNSGFEGRGARARVIGGIGIMPCVSPE